MSQDSLAPEDPAWLAPGDPGLQALAAPEPSERPDMWPAGLNRAASGELRIHGQNLVALLAQQHGRTPVFIMDMDDFRKRARAWREAFTKTFGKGNAQVYYAGKAFLCLGLARVATAQGLGLDTASSGELTLALASGIDPLRVGLHGNGKSAALLHQAVSAGIGRIIIDSLAEIPRLQRVLDALPQAATVPVMIRLTTGVHAGGHEYIATAHEDQKFGLSLEPGTHAGLCPDDSDWDGRYAVSPADSPALAAVKLILADDRLELVGLHSHIGSQISAFAGFTAAAQKIIEFRGAVARETGYLVPEIDLGGGYGVAYTAATPPGMAPHEIAEKLYRAVQDACEQHDQPLPAVSVEPGRSLVAPTTITLYRVLNIKDQPVGTRLDGSVVYRRYVAVDGGMSDNIRPALYDAHYTATLANRLSAAPLVATRVVGTHCESGDIVVRNVALPADLAEGDLLAVPMTGAYGWSMSSNYNWFTRPGVLGVWQVSGDDTDSASRGAIPETKETWRADWLISGENAEEMLAHHDPAFRKYLWTHPVIP